jgi:hypothetical protein
MKNLVSISTGSFFVKKNRDYHDELARALQLKNIDGIELLVPFASDLIQFKLSKDEISQLRSLKFSTIHAPFQLIGKLDISYSTDPLYKRLMARIYKIYDQIEAKNINTHAADIKDYRIFDTKNYQHSIENEIENQKIIYYRKILDANPGFKFVLDTTHASSKENINRIVKHLSKKIIYCHLSAYNKDTHHMFLHTSKKSWLNQLNPVKKLSCPLVSETWTDTDNTKEHQKEINFIRKWLSS